VESEERGCVQERLCGVNLRSFQHMRAPGRAIYINAPAALFEDIFRGNSEVSRTSGAGVDRFEHEIVSVSDRLP